jgi:hypothetical protein
MCCLARWPCDWRHRLLRSVGVNPDRAVIRTHPSIGAIIDKLITEPFPEVTMEPRSVLLAQLDALADHLRIAEEAIDSDQIDPRLRKTVSIRFSQLFKQHHKRLKTMREQLVSGLALNSCWSALEGIEADITYLHREVLAFVEGVLIRSANIDHGLCDLADALLEDLSTRTEIPWSRLTILGETEFLSQTAEIIRLRFPDFSIWSLPIIAHEFGHLAAQELKTRGMGTRKTFPVLDMIQRERTRIGDDPMVEPFLHELFSDIFGVFVLGPAFACSAILLRFNPYRSMQDTLTHPSAARRVHVILGALGRLNRADGDLLPYEGIINVLRSTWADSLDAVGRSKPLDEGTIAQLELWTDELYERLDDNTPPGVRYVGWSQAMQLVPSLVRGSDDKLPGVMRVEDVLNAAWICRLQSWEEFASVGEEIGDRAFQLCKASARPDDSTVGRK